MIFLPQRLNAGIRCAEQVCVRIEHYCFNLSVICVSILYRYTEYRNEFISTQKKAYFEQNKQEDW